MKKAFTLATIAALSIVSINPIVAVANPVGINITLTCPVTSNPQPGAFPLTKGSSSIKGTGFESVANQPLATQWFESSSMPQNTPANLTSYKSNLVTYDSSTGIVTCSYVSNGNPNISVSYTLQNATQGYVSQQLQNQIVITLPIGQKS